MFARKPSSMIDNAECIADDNEQVVQWYAGVDQRSRAVMRFDEQLLLSNVHADESFEVLNFGQNVGAHACGGATRHVRDLRL